LPAVRGHRLVLLEQEEKSWREEMARQAVVTPEMEPLLLLRVEGEGE